MPFSCLPPDTAALLEALAGSPASADKHRFVPPLTRSFHELDKALLDYLAACTDMRERSRIITVRAGMSAASRIVSLIASGSQQSLTGTDTAVRLPPMR